ncbi:MAG: ABC transporter ATP-binding protein, partial [Burkholderiales bacterium]
VRAREFAVIVVEQHARLALRLTQQAIVLDRGRVVHRSSSAELLDDSATLDRLVAVA